MKGSLSNPQIPEPQRYPWLMISHGRKSRVTSFYSVLKDEDYTTKIPQLSDKNVCTTCDGWLVTMDSCTRECALLNLTTTERIKLPAFYHSYPPTSNSSSDSTGENEKIEWLDNYINGVCVLSKPPTVPNCILGFFAEKGSRALIWRPGQENWVEHDYGSDQVHHVTVCNQKIYGVVDFTHLVVCEIEDGNLGVRKIGLMPNDEAGVWCTLNFLVGSFGDIFYVRMSTLAATTDRIRYVDVYKFEKANSNWIKVKNIGDCLFFLSSNAPSQPISCATANSELKGNCIHFTKGRRDWSLYCYDMEENSIDVIVPCIDAVNKRSIAHFVMVTQ